jgi:putative drug exporter of the RND superfamily
LLGSTALLLAAAIPVLDLTTGSAGLTTLPDSAVSKRAFTVLERDFASAQANPVEIAIDGQVGAPALRTAVERLVASMSRDTGFGPARTQVNRRGDLALVSAPVAGDPKGKQAANAVKRLRNELIPASFAGVDAAVLVTGVTARDVDYVEQTSRALPFVIAFVLALTFVLLTFAFRSIVVPAKAVAINLLSTGASYGLIVLVFQKGIGADLLGFQQVDRVEAWVPLFLFAVLFGLSMDYHVFLLSRIRERFNQTGDNSEAVTEGIASSARIITGAALIMVAVFSGFALGDLVPFQQLGFGMAVALALDATVVRSVLVPAAMHLLGARNWYLPRWLRWLPELSLEGAAQQRPAVPPSPVAPKPE